MKKIYIPTYEELITIESYKNASVYKYILAKVVEKLLSTNTYINAMDASLREIKELTNAICYIYPQEIRLQAPNAKDKQLCMHLLDKHPSDKIHNLDNLARFDNDVLLDYGITIQVIDILYKELSHNPAYRFTYQENSLLNDIFTANHERFANLPTITLSKLIEIEPIYGLRYPNQTKVADNTRLAVAIDEYTSKYGISYAIGREYIGKDIVNNPDNKVKTLIKYLHK